MLNKIKDDFMKNISFERYVQSFEVFGKYSEEYGFQLEHLLRAGDQLPSGFSILDIGAGTGFFARDFIKNCETKSSCYHAIEPSPVHVAQLEQNLEDFLIEKKVLNEIFTPETVLNQKYDLIIMSHCMYWFTPDPEPYIMNILNYVEEDGLLVMYLQTPFSVAHLLNLLMDNKLPVNRIPNPKINSWTIQDILDKNHVKYDIKYLPGTLRADEIFKKSNRKLLHEIISFFLSVEVESIAPATLERAEEALKKLSYKDDSGVKLNLEVGAITIAP